MISVKLDSLIAVTTNVSLHDMYTFAKQYLSNIIIPKCRYIIHDIQLIIRLLHVNIFIIP